ncbi:MAG TPA: hypothetical protein VHQ64_02425 [Pyrinomonadaceae bacterium]|nr:hypothetical protein [Pyrinomonadaceae bacterium]
MVKSVSTSASYSASNFENQVFATTIEWLTAAALAIATGAIVIWQNAHLAVLWDLSYTLEHSYRITLGDVPYRDFPFVHPPLTFLIQAAIIKLTGRVYWHTTAYCAIASAVGTILTWRILRRILFALPYARTLALLLTLPLVCLGIYCIFPHPFYDPDCTLAILVSLLFLLHLDGRPDSFAMPLLTGITLVVPLFVKQNTGLLFLLSSLGLLGALTIWQRIKHERLRHYAITIVAALLTLALAILLIHRIAGLGNYWHWTIRFAAERRTPARGEMLEIYTAKMNFVWLAMIAGAIAVTWFNRARRRWLLILSAVLFAFPFVWPAIYLLRDSDPSERAERLINVWPVLLITSIILAVVTIHRRTGIAKVLPFVIIAAIQGCFMSQQLWGSTYAIWPLFVILFAMTLSDFLTFVETSSFISLDAALVPHSQGRTSPPSKRSGFVNWLTLPVTTAAALSLCIAGVFYVRSHERLTYANLDEGELRRSTLPSLKGLSTRGDWIPSFEELVHEVNGTIAPDAGILLLPGEDAFYYATGRRPQFPVLLFDHTVNPYSPEQIRALCRERNIQWLIVKQDLQNEEDAVDTEKEQIVSALEADFEQVESLSNYEIYKRIDPNAKKDSDDDDDDDDKP